MATLEEDRQWVIELYEANEGRKPTVDELNDATSKLQSGWTREQYVRAIDRYGDVDGWLTRTYRDIFGRDPNESERAEFTRAVRAGEVSRTDLRNWLAGQPEALLREPAPVDPSTSADAQDAFAYVEAQLNDYDLGSLSTWAWDQIKAGNSPAQIMQELRKTPEYQQRFKGLGLRRQNGYSAISEGEYIALERSYRQMMRAAGLQPGFYDSPDDFANFIGKDVSPQEMQSRLNDYYLAAVQGPSEITTELQRLYGVGPSSLVSYFIDPDRALPLIQRQFEAARKGGIALRTAYGQLSVAEAERLAELGITDQQAQEGFQFLTAGRELFTRLPGEHVAGGTLTRQQQQAAVFEGDVELEQSIRSTQQSRVSAGSGGQAFQVGNRGVVGLGRE